jgi:DNA mismatch repair protein MutS
MKTQIEKWTELKEQYPDTMLVMRMGDFYEVFGVDAAKASAILGLTKTTRNKGKEDALLMAGFPYHQVDAYLAKLVSAGVRVAICEQSLGEVK